MKNLLIALISLPILAGCISGKIDYKAEGEIISKNMTHNVMCRGVKGYDAGAGDVAKARVAYLKSKDGFDMNELHFWVDFNNDLQLIKLKNSGLEKFCNKKK